MSDTIVVMLCYLVGVLFFAVLNYIEYLGGYDD